MAEKGLLGIFLLCCKSVWVFDLPLNFYGIIYQTSNLKAFST